MKITPSKRHIVELSCNKSGLGAAQKNYRFIYLSITNVDAGEQRASLGKQKSDFQSAQRRRRRFNPKSATKWSPPPLPPSTRESDMREAPRQ